MQVLFEEYIIRLYHDVPAVVYASLAFIFCIGTILLLVICGNKRGARLSLGLLLFEYVTLLYSSTVYYRTELELPKYDFTPFWSYKAIHLGQSELISENIMNVVVFAPIGLLICFAFRKIKWWQILMAGLSLSISIEVLQFLFKRGFSEFDDVMHNTLGCLIGYSLYSLLRLGYKKVCKSHIAVC